MIQVKICGITNLEDALCAASNGAAAVGFIFYPPSPRYIAPQKASEIIDRLPPDLVKVGVFVNERTTTVQEIFNDCRLDMVQLHGDESPEYCRAFPARQTIKALALENDGDLKKAAAFDVSAILVDSRHAGLYGGTGKTANWEMASQILQPLILSGGLQEENILEAIRGVHPSALDINSGVERSPGKKDPGKIARLIGMIQSAPPGDEVPQIFVQRETL
jgi:phosphoribosylanthranilate isomerase